VPQAYTEQRNLHFKLLSDFEPKGAVSRQYGAYRTADGMSERALFVIDANGVIAWSYLSPIRVNPAQMESSKLLRSCQPKSCRSQRSCK